MITAAQIKKFVSWRYPFATRDTLSAGWNIHKSFLSYISDDDAKDEMQAQLEAYESGQAKKPAWFDEPKQAATFADDCYKYNTIDELLAARYYGPLEEDLKAYGLTPTEWLDQINEAISRLQKIG